MAESLVVRDSEVIINALSGYNFSTRLVGYLLPHSERELVE